MLTSIFVCGREAARRRVIRRFSDSCRGFAAAAAVGGMSLTPVMPQNYLPVSDKPYSAARSAGTLED